MDLELQQGDAEVFLLSPVERHAFAGNCLALSDQEVWMSRTARQVLSPVNATALKSAGFAVREVTLDEIEKAGGSLRCCVAEIY